MDAEPFAFSSKRSIAPMLWVLVALCSIELAVVHLLVALWSRPAAIMLSIVSLATIAWLVRGIRSLSSLPSTLTPAALTLRAGRLARVSVPLAAVAGLRDDWDIAALKAPGVRKLSLVAHPNIWVELSTPVTRRGRTIHAIAHRLDDPAAFAAALDALRGHA